MDFWLPAMYNKPLFGVHTACVYHAGCGGMQKLSIGWTKKDTYRVY